MRPRAEPQCREKTWRISVVANKRWERLGVEKETACRKWRYCQPTNASNVTLHHRIGVGRAEISGSLEVLREDRHFSLKLDDPPSTRRFREPVRRRRWRGYPPRGGRESRLRLTPNRPARYQRAGFGEEGQPHPCRSANGNCAETSEDLTPSQGRHSDLRHRENHMIAGNGGRDGENGPDRRTQDRRPCHCESGLTHNERRCTGDDANESAPITPAPL